jgi:hypothetical protein
MNLIFFCPKKRGPSSSRLGNLPVPSICIVPAGQNVFLEGGFHETSVLLDHSLDVPTAWRETWDLALKTSLCLDAFAMLWALYAEILSMENLGFFFFSAIFLCFSWTGCYLADALKIFQVCFKSYVPSHALLCRAGCDGQGAHHHQCQRRSSCDIAAMSWHSRSDNVGRAKFS